MECVDLKICYLMEDLANVIHLLMLTMKAHAVHHTAGVGTLIHTAHVLDALTSGNIEVLICFTSNNIFEPTIINSHCSHLQIQRKQILLRQVQTEQEVPGISTLG